MAEVVPFRFQRDGTVAVLDQTLLPAAERYLELSDVSALCEAIATLRVRGAPLLGIMGAAGLALATRSDASDESLRRAVATIIATRPTAVDLAAVTNAALVAVLGVPMADRVVSARAFAEGVVATRVQQDRAMGLLGAPLIEGGVLTHCNTGALATGGIGSALGVIRTAWERGNIRRVFVTETRPLLQGARLTMWELARLGIPATLLPDTAVASLIASGRIDAVITGADRIAANGDTANKIGTYGLALAAAAHSVPFFVAAPTSTFDASCADGSAIPIEFRSASEVGGFDGQRWSPEWGEVFNPAFDVTPANLISAIITESSVNRPPFQFQDNRPSRHEEQRVDLGEDPLPNGGPL